KRGIPLHTTGPWNKGKSEGSYKALRSRFLKNVNAGDEGVTPAFLIHPRASLTIAALQGGFCKSEKPPYNPMDVHPYKDVCDALRFLNDNLMGVTGGAGTFQRKMHSVALRDVQW